MRNINNYGERTCLECGATFLPINAGQVTCSKDCSQKRRSKKKNISESIRRKQKNKEFVDIINDLEWLNCLYEIEIEKNKALMRELAKKSIDNSSTHIVKQKSEAKVTTKKNDLQSMVKGKKLLTCERMHVVGTSLPCGEREECFLPACNKMLKKFNLKIQKGERVCPVCKKAFTSEKESQIYCTPSCAGKNTAYISKSIMFGN